MPPSLKPKPLTVSAQRAILREARIYNDWDLAAVSNTLYVSQQTSGWHSGWYVTRPGFHIAEKGAYGAGMNPSSRYFLTGERDRAFAYAENELRFADATMPIIWKQSPFGRGSWQTTKAIERAIDRAERELHLRQQGRTS